MKTSRRTKAFSMIDLLLIIAAVVGIAFVVLPWLAKSRSRGSRISCSNNLKQTAITFYIWAGDNNDRMPMQVSVKNGGAMELAEQGSAYAVFLVMSNELNTPKVLFCPEESSRQRTQAVFFGSPRAQTVAGSSVPFGPTNNLSYFVGLDATLTNAQAILAGDDNLMLGKVRAGPGLARADQRAARVDQGAPYQSRLLCYRRWLGAKPHDRSAQFHTLQCRYRHQPPRDAMMLL